MGRTSATCGEGERCILNSGAEALREETTWKTRYRCETFNKWAGGIHLVQGGVNWWAALNMVMNLWIA